MGSLRPLRKQSAPSSFKGKNMKIGHDMRLAYGVRQPRCNTENGNSACRFALATRRVCYGSGIGANQIMVSMATYI